MSRRKDKIPPVSACKGRWCEIKNTCLRYLEPEVLNNGEPFDEKLKRQRKEPYQYNASCGWWWNKNFKAIDRA